MFGGLGLHIIGNGDSRFVERLSQVLLGQSEIVIEGWRLRWLRVLCVYLVEKCGDANV